MLSIARAGRAARVGTRAGRLLRFVRLVRLFRLIKFTRVFQQTKGEEDQEEDEGAEEEEYTKPSEVWRTMSQLMSRKLVMGVMAILIIYPLLDPETEDRAPLLLLRTLEEYAIDDPEFSFTIENFMEFNQDHYYKIVYLGTCATGLANSTETYPVAHACSGAGFEADYGATCPECSCYGEAICAGAYQDILCADPNYNYAWANCTEYITKDLVNSRRA
ncbi:hypothetical protein CYMTET_32509 [Cymbomonas tetramitiformis]|uniref:Uncharacterized protein n=1 Tax=Cymbomonas tetramitiformis TaxID=36881 RepID=A0AAE0FEX4_9CHLO|nr:hypothetical protein CYMTET_32509 [Cymbomonas tetramitiformis]